MEVSNILDGLNKEQRAAVSSESKNTLVLAGAGSGKTKVLVHRIAWLIEVENISPWNVMAVTFTNKAANEMLTRTGALINAPVKNMWIGTFHGLAHRFLRTHFKEAGLADNFQILDSEDQYRTVRRVLKELNLDEKRWPPRQLQWQINQFKDDGLRAADIQVDESLYTRTIHKVYGLYEQKCQNSGLVDFADLLLRTFELLRDNSELLMFYQKRFTHILVDEFQDTNKIQYAWIKLLAGNTSKVFVVGDDDQSIYGWRGAQVGNVYDFENSFPEVAVYKLEQNYRSTANILNAANALIKQNSCRMEKNLWTEGASGELINLYQAYNDLDEADFVIEKVTDLVTNGQNRSQIAILYRSNAQSRLFEERLISNNVPYRVYGGLRFFDRAEIKDALAYLRLIANPDDDVAFERAVNQPARGIGVRTMEILREQAQVTNVSLWQSAVNAVKAQTLAARSANALANFISLISKLAKDTDGLELAEQVEHVIHDSGLLNFYAKDKSERGQAKVENLKELLTAAKQFVSDDNEESILNQFLAQAALDAGDTQAANWEDCVQLMTLHSAKGLEFSVVFMCGMEEGLFPHSMSSDDPAKLEEERRLCYVGITRAREYLYLTLADSRRHYGEDKWCRPSRFLDEIPPELLNELRVRQSAPGSFIGSQASSFNRVANNSNKKKESPYQPGQRVKHAKFGEGTVLLIEGTGKHTRVQINFDRLGAKWLVAAYAKLATLES